MLDAVQQSDPKAAEELLPLIYDSDISPTHTNTTKRAP